MTKYIIALLLTATAAQAETIGTFTFPEVAVQCDINTQAPTERNAGIRAAYGDPAMLKYFHGGCVVMAPGQSLIIRWKSDLDFGYYCVSRPSLDIPEKNCYLIAAQFYRGPEPRWGAHQTLKCPICFGDDIEVVWATR